MTVLAYNVHLAPYFTKRGFSPGTPSSPSLLKSTFAESNLGCRQFLHRQDSLQASFPGAPGELALRLLHESHTGSVFCSHITMVVLAQFLK